MDIVEWLSDKASLSEKTQWFVDAKNFRDAAAEIARLRADVEAASAMWVSAEKDNEALRVDSERLDWLDTQRSDMVQQGPCGEPELYGHEWGVCAQEYNVRAAIDAARGKDNG